MKLRAAFFIFLLICLSKLYAESGISRIVLMGDSTVITSYLPLEYKELTQFQRAVDKAYPKQHIEVTNIGRGGNWIPLYVVLGNYEKDRAILKGADVVFIRFGINDHKRVDKKEFSQQLDHLITLVKEDFPSAKIILETSTYVDPNHFAFDRNAVLNPYWETIRQLAREKNLPVCDIYNATRVATENGNWDLRIRHGQEGSPAIFDNQHDAGKENDKTWFTNIHPNPEGVRQAVQEEVKTLKRIFPDKLPEDGGKKERDPYSRAEYEARMQFTAERVTSLRKVKKSLSDSFDNSTD